MRHKPFVRGIFSGIVAFLLSCTFAYGNAQDAKELYLKRLEQDRAEYVSQRNGLYLQFGLLTAIYPRATVAVIMRDAGFSSVFKGLMEQKLPGWDAIAAMIGTGFCLEEENIYNCAFVSEKLYDINRQLESINKQIDSINNSVGYQIHLQNDCRHPLEFAFRFQDYEGNWHTEAWWYFSGNEGAFLSSDGISLRLKSPTIHYYAKTTDTSNLVWEGNNYNSYAGETLGMRELTLSLTGDYAYEATLICDEL